ncbi:hypothetical protein LXL04_022994 [Taraxacum kok-saghyz]
MKSLVYKSVVSHHRVLISLIGLRRFDVFLEMLFQLLLRMLWSHCLWLYRETIIADTILFKEVKSLSVYFLCQRHIFLIAFSGTWTYGTTFTTSHKLYSFQKFYNITTDWGFSVVSSSSSLFCEFKVNFKEGRCFLLESIEINQESEHLFEP